MYIANVLQPLVDACQWILEFWHDLIGDFEGSWGVAIKEFRAAKGKRGYWQAVHESKDPTMFMVLFEDTAALIGVIIALAGIAASEALHRPVLDGAASIGIGLLLARYWVLDVALSVYITFLYSIPSVALVPLVVLWAGFETTAKVIILFMFAFFPMVINTYQGVKAVDPKLVEVGRAFR